MQSQQGFDSVVEWKRSIFRHKALKRDWEIVILQNLLDKIALKYSPRTRRISRVPLIEYFGCQVAESDPARPGFTRDRYRRQLRPRPRPLFRQRVLRFHVAYACEERLPRLDGNLTKVRLFRTVLSYYGHFIHLGKTT